VKRLGAVTVALFTCALVIAAPARAQDSTTVPLGAHLRVRVDAVRPWQRGTFAGVAFDTLLLRSRRDSAVRRISLASLREIEIRERDARMRESNTILGFILGAGTGVLVLHLGVRRCEARHPHTDGPPCAIGYVNAPFFALIGAGIGGVVGNALPANRWRPVAIMLSAAR
jgi:hypothetical protein